MHDHKPTWKRKRVLIEPEFQMQFSLRWGLALVLYLLLFFNIATLAPIVPYLPGTIPEGVLSAVQERTEYFLGMVALPLGCTFVCLLIHGIYLSFRVAGPNHRFQSVLRDLSALRVHPAMRIRSKDYLQETARELDRALRGLYDHLHALKKQGAQIAQGLRDVCAKGDAAPELEATMSAVSDLEKLLGQVELVGLARQPDELHEENSGDGDGSAQDDPAASALCLEEAAR